MIDLFDEIIERLEGLPYEEWLVIIQDYIASDIQLSYRVLRYIAINHDDSSWRFNAIQILIDSNLLREEDVSSMLKTEEDEEIIGLLQNTTDSF